MATKEAPKKSVRWEAPTPPIHFFDDYNTMFNPTNKELRLLNAEVTRLREVERSYVKLKTAVKCLLTQEQLTMIELAIKD